MLQCGLGDNHLLHAGASEEERRKSCGSQGCSLRDALCAVHCVCAAVRCSSVGRRIMIYSHAGVRAAARRSCRLRFGVERVHCNAAEKKRCRFAAQERGENGHKARGSGEGAARGKHRLGDRGTQRGSEPQKEGSSEHGHTDADLGCMDAGKRAPAPIGAYGPTQSGGRGQVTAAQQRRRSDMRTRNGALLHREAGQVHGAGHEIGMARVHAARHTASNDVVRHWAQWADAGDAGRRRATNDAVSVEQTREPVGRRTRAMCGTGTMVVATVASGAR
ncbi:hypothetical protein BD413DRAFT_568656 [Trametes elegans]|nr:hypothetical protein BD413DRAFT_568656 [Trametes elegans]